MNESMVSAELSDEALEQVVGGVIIVDPPVIPVDPQNDLHDFSRRTIGW